MNYFDTEVNTYFAGLGEINHFRERYSRFLGQKQLLLPFRHGALPGEGPEQIDKVTQSNTASTEENTLSAEELAYKAQQLKN